MSEVLGELASRAFDGDLAGLDVHLDCRRKQVSIRVVIQDDLFFFCLQLRALSRCRSASLRTSLWNLQRLLRMNVLHLVGISGVCREGR